MDSANSPGSEVRTDPTPGLQLSDDEIIAHAAFHVVEVLGLCKDVIYPDPTGLVLFYDNLAATFGGDEELMRHWVRIGNQHLGYTPMLNAHIPMYLEEMNKYLEAFRYH